MVMLFSLLTIYMNGSMTMTMTMTMTMMMMMMMMMMMTMTMTMTMMVMVMVMVMTPIILYVNVKNLKEGERKPMLYLNVQYL